MARAKKVAGNQVQEEIKATVKVDEPVKVSERASVTLKTFTWDYEKSTMNEKAAKLVIDADNVKNTQVFAKRIQYHFYNAHKNALKNDTKYQEIREIVSTIEADAARRYDLIPDKSEEVYQDCLVQAVTFHNMTMDKYKSTLAVYNVYTDRIEKYSQELLSLGELTEEDHTDTYAKLWAIAAKAPLKFEWQGMKDVMRQLKDIVKEAYTEDGSQVQGAGKLRDELRNGINSMLALNFMTGENDVYTRSRINFSRGDVDYLSRIYVKVDKLGKNGLFENAYTNTLGIQNAIIKRCCKKLQERVGVVWEWDEEPSQAEAVA